MFLLRFKCTLSILFGRLSFYEISGIIRILKKMKRKTGSTFES